MKHARQDYDRIQDPEGKIPADEPVFLLRGQDICAPGAILSWAAFAEHAGASPEIVQAAKDQAKAMIAWQHSIQKGDAKVPDMPD